jgi:hypothetical protein
MRISNKTELAVLPSRSPRDPRVRSALILAGILAVFLARAVSAAVDFNTDIRPLLSDRCFACHGPDEGARKARLRFDTAEGIATASEAGSDAAVIIPGDAEKSDVYRRVIATDPLDLMPPPESNLKLTEEEQALIGRWIDEGAVHEAHWAFQAIRKPPVPETETADRIRNPIDAFVQARLEVAGLTSAPEASRERLIRRLSFDLTGLPPSLEQIDTFLMDETPEAYEKAVDRLLSSPGYGERRANEWLDLARYADTYGYQNDLERDVSPWRDWVIRAFNENLPYDEFIVWQLAGDLLKEPSQDQILATAFNRLHRQTNEGGSIEEEFRTEYVADRVITASTAFLGLTMECARCHDHKFDPITQEDFYSMFAFFNNIDESGLYSHFTRATPSPTLLLYPEGVAARHGDLLKRIRELQLRKTLVVSAARERFSAWQSSGRDVIELPAPVASYRLDVVENGETPDAVNTNRLAKLVDSPMPVEGHRGPALQFSGDNSLVCREAGDFNRATPFSIALWLKPGEVQERAVIFHRSRAWTDSGSRGYELVLESMRPAFALIHFWPGNAIQVRADDPLPVGVWSQLTVTYDGMSRAEGVRLYRNGAPLKVEIIRDRLFKDILHRKEWGDADVGKIELTLAGRFRDSGFKHGTIDEFQVFDRFLTPVEVRRLADPKAAPPTRDELFAWYLARVDVPYRELQQELLNVRAEEGALVNDVPEIMVMREMAEFRVAHVLKRGAYDAPGEAVNPGMPASLLRFNPDLPGNRLGLARWMTDPQNPLTARVAVNRVWQTCFGRGLVATAEDFGSQGDLPTHPKLLDWLAHRFMESGWNLKALFKLVVMSATYRQVSESNPDLLERDLDNRLLARGPKHRLQAEVIRDSALAISGLLAPRIGGPSVKPYQPAGLWRESGTGKTYVQDKGEGLYRRSLYTFWRRTAPPPSMLTFDATSREVCTAKRESTTTPLQALVLLNDPQFIEAARVLAERLLLKHPNDLDLRVEVAFRLTTGRRPSSRENEVIRRLFREQAAAFAEDPEDASAFLANTGERALEASLPVDELAATTILVSTLMNLDEFVTKQ